MIIGDRRPDRTDFIHFQLKAAPIGFAANLPDLSRSPRTVADDLKEQAAAGSPDFLPQEWGKVSMILFTVALDKVSAIGIYMSIPVRKLLRDCADSRVDCYGFFAHSFIGISDKITGHESMSRDGRQIGIFTHRSSVELLAQVKDHGHCHCDPLDRAFSRGTAMHFSAVAIAIDVSLTLTTAIFRTFL